MIKSIFVFATALLSASISYADNHFKAGQYEFVKLAVTPDNHVQGYYHEVMGEGVTRTCSFFFEGAIGKDDKTYINTWSSGQIEGVIDNQPDSLFIEMADDHPGCASVSASEAKYGMNLTLIEKKPWIGLGIAKDSKVYLNVTATSEDPSKVYIVKDDVFGILQVKDENTLIEYINEEGKSFKRWIKNSTYTALKSPK